MAGTTGLESATFDVTGRPILRGKHHCSLQEGRRVTDILRRVVAETLDR
jgi:hypothetical protein